jgi:CPA1 family monovalent cation:H+ antiporter
VHFTTHDQLLLMALLGVLAVFLIAAPVLRIPYPILLVLGGLALGFVPGVPELALPPDVVLVAVLPPLLYLSAYRTSLRDLRANTRAIGILAIGLVVATTVTVAVVAHAAVDQISWTAAFTLGAVVAPTDTIAATAIMHRLGVPRRLVSIVESESLVNDGTALVLYRVAVVAAVSGMFSIWDVSWRFAWAVLGGVAIGIAVGFVIAQVRRRVDNPPVEVTISLMSGYLAFIPAAAASASGVIAVVTAGVYLGWRTPELTSVQTRLQGEAVWSILAFVLNALLFALVGLQLPRILDALTGRSGGELARWGLLITGTVILTRIAWVPVFTHLPRLLWRSSAAMKPFSHTFLLSWAGMRGAVSLAAALAIPLATDAGAPFPERDLIIFLTFCVILGTLVLQGLSLPALIRAMHIEPDRSEEAEDAQARIRAAEAALARLEELVGEDWIRNDTAERMRGLYGFRINRFTSRFDDEADGAIEEQSQAYQRLRRELLDAERDAVTQLGRSGAISGDVVNRVRRDLDLEDARLDA